MKSVESKRRYPALMCRQNSTLEGLDHRAMHARIGELYVKVASCLPQDASEAVPMSTSTLTIRLPTEQREALKRSAKALKKTESEYIRDLLQRDLDSRPFGERAGQLIGCLDSSKLKPGAEDGFREAIHKNNWRPA